MKGATILFRAGPELKAAIDRATVTADVTQDAFIRAAVVAMVEQVQRTGSIATPRRSPAAGKRERCGESVTSNL